MKKEYIRPESRLFVINLTENIAFSGKEYEVHGHVQVSPAGYYSTVSSAVCTVPDGSPDEAYMDEFIYWVSKGYIELYYNCFK